MNAPAAVLMQRKDAEPPSGVLLDALPMLLAQALEYSDAVRVVRDVDDYLLNFNRLGGWDGWARHLGAGTTVFGAPTYVALVLLERSMGRATSLAVDAALRQGRAVFFADVADNVPRVRRVTAMDRCEGNDYENWANARTETKDEFAKWCAWQIQFPQARTQDGT